jgi:hypothetical protein
LKVDIVIVENTVNLIFTIFSGHTTTATIYIKAVTTRTTVLNFDLKALFYSVGWDVCHEGKTPPPTRKIISCLLVTPKKQ